MAMANWTHMYKPSPISMVNSQRGVTLWELMIAMTIISFCLSAIFGLLGNANASFFNADVNIDLRNSLRLASDKMTTELRNTGYKAGVAQFAILTGAGVNGSDIIRFAIPIQCSNTMTTILDASGNPAYWGAPLTWGCNNSSCMDANNDCSVAEYRYIQYSLNGSQQLERKILDGALSAVSGGTTVIANYISNFNVSLASEKFTIVLTGQKESAVNKTFTVSYTSKLLINNQGG